jgi:hypothetical protein
MPLRDTDIPVRTDMFIHDLEPFTLDALRRAVEQGLTPAWISRGMMTPS